MTTDDVFRLIMWATLGVGVIQIGGLIAAGYRHRGKEIENGPG